MLAPGALLLFLKFYNPLTESLSFIGTHVALNTHTLADLVPVLIASSGLPAGQELAVFEEVPATLPHLSFVSTISLHAFAFSGRI